MLGVTCPAVPPPVKIIRFIITSRLEYVLFLHTSNIIKIISILYFLKEIGQVAKLWRNLKTSQKFEGSKMNDKKDEFKECIAREFEEIAREEEEFLENDTSLVVPEGTKEAVLARVREQIRAYEMEPRQLDGLCRAMFRFSFVLPLCRLPSFQFQSGAFLQGFECIS